MNELLTALGRRPCVVKGRPGFFHQWCQIARPFNAVMAGTTSGQISYVIGLVEHEDGSMREYTPTDIKFVDVFERDPATVKPCKDCVHRGMETMQDVASCNCCNEPDWEFYLKGDYCGE